MRMRFGTIFLGYVRYHKKSIYLFFICSFIFGIVFYLNNIPVESVLYALLLCLFVFTLFAAADFIGFARKHDKLYRMQKEITLGISNLPLPENLIEEDYWELLRISHADKIKLLSAADNEKSESLEYYTMWVHQIKTPIAAMRLILQSEPGVQNLEIDAELFKIEQYVEMVLTYIRLGCNGNDL